MSTSGLDESGWICPVQTSRQLPREQKESNAPGITQGFSHLAHPARVQGSLDDLLPVKDDFWWVTPEFEIPAVLWCDTHSHEAGVEHTPVFWPGLYWCRSDTQGGAAENRGWAPFYAQWCLTQCIALRVCLGGLGQICNQVPYHLCELQFSHL